MPPLPPMLHHLIVAFPALAMMTAVFPEVPGRKRHFTFVDAVLLLVCLLALLLLVCIPPSP